MSNIDNVDSDLSNIPTLPKHPPIHILLKQIIASKIALGILIVLALSFIVILGVQNKTSQKNSLVSSERKTFDNKPSIIPTSPTSLLETPREVIGFFPSWMVAKKATVYPQHMTQIIYFGLAVDKMGNLVKFDEEKNPVLEWQYLRSPYFETIRNQAKKTGTRILITIKSFDNLTIDTLVSSKASIQRLSAQLIELIDQFNLSGVNIDFEYVTDTSFPTTKHFNQFLEIVRDTLKQKDQTLVLSIDVNAAAVIDDRAYDMVKIGEVADEVILMAYDYHTPTSRQAGPVSPIKAGEGEHSIEKSLNSLAGRVPFEKIILGIPFYGYEWESLSSGYKSVAINNSGALATYKRVRELIDARRDLSIRWSRDAQSPWLVYQQSGAIKQIYYENERSISRKIEFTKQNNLAGIAIFALGYEGDYQEIWNPIKSYKAYEVENQK